MEHVTQDTQIALIQQSVASLTNTIARIEVMTTRIDEATRKFVTIETLKSEYVTKETHESLNQKVKVIDDLQKKIEPLDSIQTKLNMISYGLGTVILSIVGFVLNSIFKIIGD